MTKLNDKQDKAELDNAASRVRNLLKRGVYEYTERVLTPSWYNNVCIMHYVTAQLL